jgi:CBS domain-containing protein
VFLLFDQMRCPLLIEVNGLFRAFMMRSIRSATLLLAPDVDSLPIKTPVFDVAQAAVRGACLWSLYIFMEFAMQAEDIMTPTVISVEPNDTVERAIRLMLQYNVSGLPVIDSAGRLAGMVTEGDFLRRSEITTERRRPRWLEFLMGPGRLADEYVRTHGRKVADVMSVDTITVDEDTPLEEIVSLMEKHRIKRVPVLRGDNVVGILSRANLLRALAGIAAGVKKSSPDDRTIRDNLLADLQKQKWSPMGSIDVTVHDGVANLWGCILDERERQALIVAAENTAGVKRVNDHMAFVEPMSGMVLAPPEETKKAESVNYSASR